ncbi:hypothetical protein ACFVZJ_37265 [Streptomyces sp. NPDC058322]|uniref:Uncharacterized protein n=1 Tax=Streptomyces sanglieri TaxID=193460 RepID=A0ABW2WQR6_9ACTN
MACPRCGALLRPSLVRGEGPWNQRWRAGLADDRQHIPFDNLEADVLTPDGTVVELQYGYLSRQDIRERQLVYPSMVWLFCAVDAHRKGRLGLRIEPGQPLVNFKWVQPRETLDACTRPVFLDLGPSAQAGNRHLILKITRKHDQPGHALTGRGLLYTADVFHDWMAHGTALTEWICGQDDLANTSTTDAA